ncbi:MAG TPA: tetratricopeptide repeat protein [Tepidisphaeraceae bacterium]|nr:tetratricopeptide repeat protein [Tepidisphaeraceae bacterium]
MTDRITLTLLATTLCAFSIIIGCARGGGGRNGADADGSIGGQSSPPRAIERYVEAVRAKERGDTDAAIGALERATEANPNLTMARGLLGDLYRAEGEYEKATAQYEALVRLDPYSALNHYKLGVSYQFLQRLRESANAYLRAIELDPKDADAHMNLALVYLAMGQLDDAVRYAERATLLDPSSAVAFSNLGVVLEARGDFARAESAYRRSLDLDSTQIETLLNLGANLIKQGKSADAVSIMERVLQQSDTPQIRKRYGDALARAGKYDEAVKQYEAALAKDPRYYPAMNEIGWVRIAEYRKGLELEDAKRITALQMWRKSLEVNPNQPRIATAIRDWDEKGLFRR